MAFRFVHTADVHLDSPLRSLALRQPALAEMIGTATRAAFARTIDLCLAERVDALLIAGDLYDGGQTSMKTAAFLASQLARLDAAGIRTFIVRGNHDAESRLSRELVLPESVTVFSGRAGVHVLEGAADGRDVAVHGISFAEPRAPESLLPRFKPALADTLNIGLLHTSLGGAAGHDTYAPCSVADLVASGFDYWALGHVHARAIHHPARPAVIMPGQPQGRDINEAGPKSVTLASLDGDGGVTVSEHVTAVAQFNRMHVDVSGVTEWRDLVARVGAGLASARERAVCDHVVVRLDIGGVSPLAWRTRVDADLLLEEARQAGERIGYAWVEAVVSDVRAPGAEVEALEATGADPVEELRALVSREVLPSDSFQALARGIADEVRGQLPTQLATMLGRDEAAFDAAVAALAETGAADVLAHLRAREPDRGEG